MNDNRKTRLLTGIILALILLNAALLAWIYFKPGRMPRRQHGEHWNTFLPDTLKFTPQQRQEFDSLRRSYFEKTGPMARELRTARQEFYRLLDDTAMTDKQLYERAAHINGRISTIDVITLQHFRQVARLCTPAQRAQLKTILIEMPFVDRGMGRGGGPPFGRRRNHSE